MKSVIVFILSLFFSITLSSSEINFTKEELAFLSSNHTMIVSNELDWYPYDFNEKGIPRGYAVDYLKLIAKKIGINLKFVTGKWSYLENEFKKGNIDILYPAKKLTSREKIALFSKAFMDVRFSLITTMNQKEIKNIKDLRGKKLAIVKDALSTRYIKRHNKDVIFKEFKSVRDALEAVAFGVADAVICDFFTANYIIKQEMFSNLKAIAKVKLFSDQSLYFMFQKDNEVLRNIFNKAMQNLSSEEILELKSKWLENTKSEYKEIKLTPLEKRYIERKKEITMCIDPNWMPLEENQDGVHVGISSDYMELIEKKIGINIRMIETKTWLESLELAKKRECDILSLVMRTPNREEYLNFTKPYLTIPLVLVTTIDKIFFYNVSLIEDKKIGIVKGYAYGEILRVKYPHMKLIDVKNLKEGLDKVQNGELFGFIGSLATVGYKIQRSYIGSLKIAGKFDEEWKLGIGVRNDEPELLSILNKAISSISSKKHQEIFNKWISVNYHEEPSGIPKELLWFFGLIIIFVLYRQNQLKKHNEELEILSSTDKLTGIYNRLKLDEILTYQKHMFDRYKRVFSIIIFDIDDFKKVNDMYGHQTGDDVLKSISTITMFTKRKSDLFGRWGGEEFLVICPDTNLDGAVALSEKIRKEIEKYDFGVGPQSVSFGVSEYKKGDTIEKAINRADSALYRAKRSGKNRVCS